MKIVVYIVEMHSWTSSEIRGVFSTMQKAQDLADGLQTSLTYYKVTVTPYVVDFPSSID